MHSPELPKFRQIPGSPPGPAAAGAGLGRADSPELLRSAPKLRHFPKTEGRKHLQELGALGFASAAAEWGAQKYIFLKI